VGRTLVANKLLAGSACGKRCRGRPLNSVVRKHFEMIAEVHAPSRKSTISAIFGAVLIVVALAISLPVAVNFPESWPGAVLVLALAGLGAFLIIGHFNQRRRAHQASGASGAGNAF
jgi:hypothetical protein